MVVLSFIAMYFLMYAMVDARRNVYASFNQVYMAGLMTAPMTALELLLMRAMYPSTKLNAFVLAASAVVLASCWWLIRAQVGISDKQFLRSMIPHHAGALLMCEQASLQDPEVKALCEQIRTSQQAEIDQMKAMLRDLQQ